MVISKKSPPPSCNIICNNHVIKQVDQFKYLGSVITSDGRPNKEVRKRIAMAKNAFSKMKPLFTNHNVTLSTKLRVLKCYVWSLMLYGCECWTISKEIQGKLEATEMWFLRRILKISWREMKTNKEVLEMAGTDRTLMNTIRKRQLEFLGHVIRKKEMEHLTLTGKIEGKRSRGRQRRTLLDSLVEITPDKRKLDFIHLADNREEWRNMVVNVCTRLDT